MYIKFQNAAVFVGEALAKQASVSKHKNPAQNSTPPSITLWSDRPFSVSKGRLVGVRKPGQSVEVALVITGGTTVTWLPPEGLLTQAQINRWLTNSSVSVRRTHVDRIAAINYKVAAIVFTVGACQL